MIDKLIKDLNLEREIRDTKNCSCGSKDLFHMNAYKNYSAYECNKCNKKLLIKRGL